MPARQKYNLYYRTHHNDPSWIGKLPVEFYSVKYDTPESKADQNPDLRTTIYWKPNMKTNENGKAEFSFYSADSPTAYSVIIEGVTSNGKIINDKKTITIK